MPALKKPEINDRVKIHTKTAGCYHNKTGTVENILNGRMTDIQHIPAGSPDAYPYWYRVRFDTPADNGGKSVNADIFTIDELTLLKEGE